MYHDDCSTREHFRNLCPAEAEAIESIEDLLRKCGFFDAVAPNEKNEKALAN